MKFELLKPTIICGTCSSTLEQGDPGGETVKKICHTCVMKTTKGADRSKVLTPDGLPMDMSFEKEVSKMTARVNSETNKPNRFVFEYQWVEANSLNPEPRLLWLIRYETYEKRLIAELGLPRTQLEEIILDMENYENELKMDIFQQKAKEEGL